MVGLNCCSEGAAVYLCSLPLSVRLLISNSFISSSGLVLDTWTGHTKTVVETEDTTS